MQISKYLLLAGKTSFLVRARANIFQSSWAFKISVAQHHSRHAVTKLSIIQPNETSSQTAYTFCVESSSGTECSLWTTQRKKEET
jgi:hypothetical protein